MKGFVGWEKTAVGFAGVTSTGGLDTMWHGDGMHYTKQREQGRGAGWMYDLQSAIERNQDEGGGRAETSEQTPEKSTDWMEKKGGGLAGALGQKRRVAGECLSRKSSAVTRAARRQPIRDVAN